MVIIVTIMVVTLVGYSVSSSTVVLRVGTTTEMAPLSPVDTNGLWYSTGYMGFLFMPLITYRAPDARFRSLPGPVLGGSSRQPFDSVPPAFRSAVARRPSGYC